MEKAVASLFKETIVQEGYRKFSVDVQSAKMLGDFENFIYEGEQEGQKVIIRFTHSSHRSYEQIVAEIDWVSYLKQQGIPVYKHFTSVDGQLLETITAQDGSSFLICCYEKLPGKRMTWQDCEQSPVYIEKWGEVIGQMHQATKSYVKPVHLTERLHWHEEDLMKLEQFQPYYTAEMNTYSKDVLKQVHNLQRTESNYGLIHSDLHLGNFNVDHNQLYVFDFDDSSYHFFASDIAIPLYYTLLSRSLTVQDDGQQAFASFFMKHFMEGYERHHRIEDDEIQTIPLFLRLRDVSLYNVMHKKYDLDHLLEKEAHLLKVVKERLEERRTIAE